VSASAFGAVMSSISVPSGNLAWRFVMPFGCGAPGLYAALAGQSIFGDAKGE
jgi:hypothetical protein